MRSSHTISTLAGAIILLGAGSAIADLVGLPASGAQVNNDPAVGIDPDQSAGQADVVGGSLAGGARVPWATLEQSSGSSQQIFVRAFKGTFDTGQWGTQGQSLNIDSSAEAQAPTIDFAGAETHGPVGHLV
jgi:hypothetical protein